MLRKEKGIPLSVTIPKGKLLLLIMAKIIVVVDVDTKCICMLMKFHIPLANNEGSKVVGFRLRASSNEVLCFFCIIPREVEDIAGPSDKAMGSVLIVEGGFVDDA